MRSSDRWRVETLHHLSDEMALALPPQLDFYWPAKKIRKILSEQAVLVLPYWGYDGQSHTGQLVIHRELSERAQTIFGELFRARFPLGSMVPISAFRWDDHRSMRANNCVGFHFRNKTGKNELSWHGYGRAIDINPLQNPYQKGNITLPRGARYEPERPGTCGSESLPVRLFKAHGFDWGGDWTSLKDYMHFEFPIAS